MKKIIKYIIGALVVACVCGVILVNRCRRVPPAFNWWSIHGKIDTHVMGIAKFHYPHNETKTF